LSWLKLDDGFAEHPKVLALSDAALRLHLRAMCWVARQETDGAIPPAALREFHTKPKLVAELVASGLWETTDVGHAIHDYLTYNPSKAKLEAEREATRERVKRFRNGVTDPQSGTHKAAPVTPLQPRIGNGDVTGLPSRPVPSPSRPQETPSGSRAEPPPASAADAAPKKTRGSKRVPADWVEKEAELQAIAAERGVSLAFELKKFRDHQFARAIVDFDAAARNWIRNAKPERVPFGGTGPTQGSLVQMNRLQRIASMGDE
jgi:hypothetical protein